MRKGSLKKICSWIKYLPLTSGLGRASYSLKFIVFNVLSLRCCWLSAELILPNAVFYIQLIMSSGCFPAKRRPISTQQFREQDALAINQIYLFPALSDEGPTAGAFVPGAGEKSLVFVQTLSNEAANLSQTTHAVPCDHSQLR